MSKFTIGTIAASILLLGGIIWISYPKSGNTTLGPMPNAQTALVAGETSYDFGTISMAKGKVSHDFTFKNTSNQPINLTKLYTSCMCTSVMIQIDGGRSYGPYGMVGMGVDTLEQAIQPGAEAKVMAMFDPAAHGPAGVGSITREITVENNAGAPLTFEFTANVTP